MVTTRRRAYDPGDSAPKRRKIDDESTPTRVSRACRICLTEVPRYLSVLTPCGHAVCRACALKLRFDAFEEKSPVHCSVCRTEGTFALLSEELIKSTPATRHSDKPEESERGVADEDRVVADAAAARDAHTAANRALVDKKQALIGALTALTNFAGEQTSLLRIRLAQRQDEHPRPSAPARPSPERTHFTDEAFDAMQAEFDERRRILDAELERMTEAEKAAEAREAEARGAFDDKKKQIQQLIERFKQKNEDSAIRGLRFSRACRACSTESPPLRSFFPACGHAVCRECADKATASESDTKCPTCNKAGDSIQLFEEVA